jgi:hypothetical protein
VIDIDSFVGVVHGHAKEGAFEQIRRDRSGSVQDLGWLLRFARAIRVNTGSEGVDVMPRLF